jgi:peptide/nickel transport system substrate-binding protein
VRIILVLALFTMACSASGPAQPSPAGSPADAPPRPQRPIVIASAVEPGPLDPRQMVGGGIGLRDFAALFSGALAYIDPQQKPTPMLAETLPQLGTDSWRVFPDGRMETVYKLRQNATWHDGVPVTAMDFVFGYQARLDPDMPFGKTDMDLVVADVQAVDDQTLLIAWTGPYIWAGALHGFDFPALPRHTLAELYATDRAGFAAGPHWREQFLGNGPYRLERWDPGVEMVVRAHPGFALGKPPTDQLRFRFITDPNTIVANLLAGTVDVAYHANIGFPQNQALEQSGWDGATEYWRGTPRFLEFQMRDWGNHQRAVLDVRVRRALLHAIDRHAIVDGLYAGKALVHHFWLAFEDPAFAAADRAVTKYEYDPARAEQLLREAGWVKGSDGITRNAVGEALEMPMLNGAAEMDNMEAAVAANYWKAVGVPSEIFPLTRVQQRDGEYRSKFRAVAYNRRGFSLDDMVWVSSQLTTPDNRWAGGNRNGYVNPQVESLWRTALVTFDLGQRESLLVEALKIMTTDAAVTPTHMQPEAMAYRAGLTGTKQPSAEQSGQLWNPWELRWM